MREREREKERERKMDEQENVIRREGEGEKGGSQNHFDFFLQDLFVSSIVQSQEQGWIPLPSIPFQFKRGEYCKTFFASNQ